MPEITEYLLASCQKGTGLVWKTCSSHATMGNVKDSLLMVWTSMSVFQIQFPYILFCQPIYLFYF